jgi:hypothetical protein
MLEDLSEDAIAGGVRGCLLACRFFPTIAEIREKVKPFMDEENRNKNLRLPPRDCKIYLKPSINKKRLFCKNSMCEFHWPVVPVGK